MAREVEEFLVRYYSLKVWYNRCIGLLMLPLLIAQFAEVSLLDSHHLASDLNVAV